MTGLDFLLRIAGVIGCGIALAALVAVWPAIARAISRQVDRRIEREVHTALTDPRYDGKPVLPDFTDGTGSI